MPDSGLLTVAVGMSRSHHDSDGLGSLDYSWAVFALSYGLTVSDLWYTSKTRLMRSSAVLDCVLVLPSGLTIFTRDACDNAWFHASTWV